MGIKSVILILLSVLIMESAGAVEPLALGSGPIDTAINLDAGAAHQSNSYRMTQSGFVPPVMPQTKTLSTSTMIYRTEKLLDKAESIKDDSYAIYNNTKDIADSAKSLRDETRSILNDTRAVADGAEKNALRVGDLVKEVRSSAESIDKKASYANQSLDKIHALYNSTLELSRKIDDLSRDFRNNAEIMNNYLSESRRLYNETLKLSNAVQIKTDQVLDQGMDAQNSVDVSVTDERMS
jgi:hypothetical protein